MFDVSFATLEQREGPVEPIAGHKMEIRYGTLMDIYGTKATCPGMTFVPAEVELAGRSFASDFRLRDQPRDQLPLVVRQVVDGGYDAAWVRARIPRVFQFTPPPAQMEKALLDVGFVAAMEQADVGIPFVCTDHYGRTALMFSDDGPDHQTRRSIASAFWRLLCQNAEDVSDFETRVYHPGAGVWLTFGCNAGDLYCEESEE